MTKNINLTYKLFFIFLFFIFFILFIHPLGGDGDYFHHIHIGKYVIENKSLPFNDNWTFTAEGKNWIGYSWLTGVVFYILYANFGAYGVSFFIALIAVLTLTLTYLFLRNISVDRFSSIISVSFLATLLATRWPSRPEIMAYPFILLILLISVLGKKYKKIVLLLPLIILAWANLYGSNVIIGIGLLIILGVKQFYEDKFSIKSDSYLLYISILFSIPCSILNGYGINSLFYFAYVREAFATQGEWFGILDTLYKSPYSYLLVFQYYLLVYFIYLFLFIIVILFSYRKIKKYYFFIFLGFSILLPFLAFRQTPLSSILSIPIFALAIKDKSKKVKIYLLLPFLVLSFLINLWIQPPSFGKENEYPKTLVEFIKNNNIYGKVFTNQKDGSFLSFYFDPKIKVFMDTRDDLFVGTNIVKDFSNVFYNNKNSLILINKYNPDIVMGDISDGSSYQTIFYSKNWYPVFIDGKYFLAVNEKIVKKQKLSPLYAIDPFSQTQSKKGMEKASIGIYKRVMDKNPTNDNKLRYAIALLSVNNSDEAIKILKTITANNLPQNSLFRMNIEHLLALAYLSKNDCINSKIHIEKIDQGLKGIIIFNPERKIDFIQEQPLLLYRKYCGIFL